MSDNRIPRPLGVSLPAPRQVPPPPGLEVARASRVAEYGDEATSLLKRTPAMDYGHLRGKFLLQWRNTVARGPDDEMARVDYAVSRAYLEHRGQLEPRPAPKEEAPRRGLPSLNAREGIAVFICLATIIFAVLYFFGAAQ